MRSAPLATGASVFATSFAFASAMPPSTPIAHSDTSTDFALHSSASSSANSGPIFITVSESRAARATNESGSSNRSMSARSTFFEG